MKQNHASRQAIVIGGSMAGLLAARALSNHFTQVMILERDPVNDRPESRKGQPQARHAHILLAGGLQILNHYFPDLIGTLAQSDAMVADGGECMRWYAHGGYRRPFHLGLKAVTMSRPFLEHQVRRRVQALANVTLLDRRAVKKLTVSADNRRVRGVVVEERDVGRRTTALAADLVVDCTSRGSRMPHWLKELRYVPPLESEVKVDIGYTTRIYRRDRDDPRGQQVTAVTPDAPKETRFGAIFAIENGCWIVSMGGWGGDHCPVDEAGFLAFARSLPAPDIYDIISGAEPLSEIFTHRLPSSLRRHYEKLPRFPQGLLVLGDAVASFNPVYGQGMTSAAMQVWELDRILEKRPAPDTLARDFFKSTASVVDIPWRLAVGADFAFPTTSGPKPLGTDLINWYVARVDRATHHDEVVGAALLMVVNLLAPPFGLFKPRVLRRVLWQGRRGISKNTDHPAKRLSHIA